NTNKCLDVRGGIFANGTAVQIFDCNGTPAQQWDLQVGETHVRVANTAFCLDAGNSPANGTPMKIWTCFDNLPAQDWFYTGDDRIALTNQGLCLDLTDGNTTNTNVMQTFQCTDGNTNQIWTFT
ncbi:carbohydrate-binding module family 13 protein, partial [Macrolepiota fuliginosa MF-IS2]